MTDSETETLRKGIFFRKLRSDIEYQTYIVKPLEADKSKYERILRDVNSTEAQMRYAQGALEVVTRLIRLDEAAERGISKTEKGR
jgi:hypothetical protein